MTTKELIVFFVMNTIWFGFFMAMIYFRSWTPFCLIVPMLFHWKVNDFREKRDET